MGIRLMHHSPTEPSTTPPMRYDLVHRLTRVGQPDAVDALPGRAPTGRAGVLTRMALRAAALAAVLATVLLAAHLAAVAAVVLLAVPPLAAWIGALVTTAVTPSLVARLLRARRDTG